MNTFRLKAYWRYCRTAKGRHDVHSPFVYRFIEEALRPAARHFNNPPAYESVTHAAWHSDILLRRIVQHFRFGEIIASTFDGRHTQIFHQIVHGTDKRVQEPCSRLHDWHALLPGQWVDDFHKQAAQFGLNDVVAVSNIHHSAVHEAAWRTLSVQPDVTLSIDLFRVGLLFFSADFKEKQHFVLKYPA